MAKFRTQKNSLVAGQISPTAFGRTDLPFYPMAAKKLQNMIPISSGGAMFRPGSRHAFTSSNPIGLYPFIYNKKEAYCVTVDYLGNVVIKRKDEVYAGALDITPSIVNATVSGTVPVSGATSASGDVYDWSFMDMQYTQSLDVLYLVHKNIKPTRISRTAEDNFTVAAFDSGLTGANLRDAWPYLPINATAKTMTVTDAIGPAPIAAGTTVTITASANHFTANHVGALFKFDYGGANIGCVQVTAYSSATSVTGTVITTIDSELATLLWWESAWSHHQGWPASIAFYYDRLAYGGTDMSPDSVWFSEDGDYNQLSKSTVTDPTSPGASADPFTITFLSHNLNRIQWMNAEKTLIVGTTNDEFVIDRETTGGFGYDNASAIAQSRYGSSYVMPQRVGDELIFVPIDQKMRALVFNFEQNAYVADPLQALFDEYPKVEERSWTYKRRIRRVAWDKTRGVLWAHDTAGNLLGMSRDRRLNYLAWHTHEMGGTDRTVSRPLSDWTGAFGGFSPTDPVFYGFNGSVVSLTVVPDPVTELDDLWIVVHRKVNGSWLYHVEYISGQNRYTDTIYDPYYKQDGTYHLDAFADYDAMSHLEGETVSVLFSGTTGLSALAGKTVTSGTAVYTETAPSGTQKTIAGYPYSGIIIPTRPDLGSQIGTSQAAIKRAHQVTIDFYKTMSAKVGADSSNLEQLLFRTASTPMGYSAELFTGFKTVKTDCDYDMDGYLYILQDEPLPFCVVSIVIEGMTYDG